MALRRSAAVAVLKGLQLLNTAAPSTAAAALVGQHHGATAAAAGLRWWSSLAGAAAARGAAASLAAAGVPTMQLGRAVQRAAWGGGQAARIVGQQQARGFSRYLQFPNRGGGWRAGGDLDSDKVLWGLIAANLGVYMLWRVDPRFCWNNCTVSIESLRQGRLHTALTAAFSHQDLLHLGANMIGLFFFGRDVGRLFGGKKLLALYLAGGLAGSLAHCGWYYYQARKSFQSSIGRRHFFAYAPPALGASAAVNAIMVVDILLFPTRTILLYGIVPMPAALLGLLWLLHDVTGTMEGKGHIAHAGHLGGAAVGLAFWAAFRRGRIRPRGWF